MFSNEDYPQMATTDVLQDVLSGILGTEGRDLHSYKPSDSFNDLLIDRFDPDQLLADLERFRKNLLADLALGPFARLPGRGKEVDVGFDTEYVSSPQNSEVTVLSYQFYLAVDDAEYSRVFYPRSSDKSGRLTLRYMLSTLIQESIELGVIDEFPSRITLCGFFLRLDLGMTDDFRQYSSQLDNIGGRLGTLKKDVTFHDELDPLDRLPSTKSYLVDDEGFNRIMSVRFIDVGSHTPDKMNLEAIGDTLGIPKLALPAGHHIERMDLLLAEDKEAFEAYGTRDAEITVKLKRLLTELSKEIAGVDSLPATASGLAVTLFEKTLKEGSLDFNQIFGMQDHAPILYDRQKGRVRKAASEKVMINRRFMYEQFIAKTYLGGRNEDFVFGPTDVSLFNDFDIAGAYTTGMCDFPVIDFSKPPRLTNDPEEFRGHVVGFALVRFEFPETVRHPSLPVATDTHGLIFPSSGTSYCTAPEIEVALNKGCKIEIIDGLILPTLLDAPRVFEAFVTKIRELRGRYPSKSFMELYVKLVGNGLYGKTAQGLKKKRVFEMGRMKSIELPYSKITYAACASHITGFIRAVIGEMLHSIPAHRTVVSVTTDGFLTDAEMSEISIDGPMASRFSALCQRVAPDKPMLECKHQVRQIIAIKTRTQLTGVASPNMPIVVAKGSVSPPIDTRGLSRKEIEILQNDYMVDLFINRQPGQETEIRPFVSLRDQITKELDVVRLCRPVRLNLEFDFKCRPVNAAMREIGVGKETEHLAFHTMPWRNVEEFDLARAIFDPWKDGCCLKTLDDWAHWQDHYVAASTIKNLRTKRGAVALNVTKTGAIGLFKRTFLRAYVRGAWGIKRTMTYAELAAWLSTMGCPTTVNDVKNAGRPSHRLESHVVPRTPQTEMLVAQIKLTIPEMDESTIFATLE